MIYRFGQEMGFKVSFIWLPYNKACPINLHHLFNIYLLIISLELGWQFAVNKFHLKFPSKIFPRAISRFRDFFFFWQKKKEDKNQMSLKICKLHKSSIFFRSQIYHLSFQKRAVPGWYSTLAYEPLRRLETKCIGLGQ